jgi:anti-sigma-K factor RskA
MRFGPYLVEEHGERSENQGGWLAVHPRRRTSDHGTALSETPCEHGADAGRWVLGTQAPEVAERFAAHLASCAPCRAEVTRLVAASERLAETAPPLTPPPELRQRLMASVHAEAGLFETARRRSPRRAGPAAAASATVAIAFAAVAWFSANHVPHQTELRTVIGRVRSPEGGVRARAVIQIELHTTTLVVTRLGAPPAGRAYQAWVIRNGSPAAPTGAPFSVTDTRDRQIRLPALDHVTEVIVTAEPPGGSLTPSLPPIVLVQLSARPGRTGGKS